LWVVDNVLSDENASLNGLAQPDLIGQQISLNGIGEDAANNVDAATFVPDVASALSAVVALLGIRPKTIRDNVTLDLPVRKVGFKTGLTFGKVQALNLLASMPYPGEDGPQDVWFADQIGISTFTDEGDSGALVLDEAGAAVGLHIGSFNGMSICTPIRRVLAAVGCKLA